MSETARAETRSIGSVAATRDTTIDARTGEPARPVWVWLASALFYVGAATVTAGTLWTWWLSVDAWHDASPLHGSLQQVQVTAEQGALYTSLIAGGEFVVTLLVTSTALIAGYHAWRGYGWTRWAGVVAAVVSFAALTLHPIAWAGTALIALGAAALWLPPVRRFFARWQARRHQAPVARREAAGVHYGPLERYRDA